MTTLEKIRALVEYVRATPAGEVMSGEHRDLVEVLQIAEGLGFDVLGALIPKTEAEADVLIDSLLSLLLQLRGDDLPPFDLERAIAEAELTD